MFRTEHFQYVPNLLDRSVTNLVFDYACLRRDTRTMTPPDQRVEGAERLYGDMLTETLLKQKQTVIEEIVGEDLWPSYSYLRLHRHGSEMAVHTDRDGSEIGVSIAIKGDRIWPLWLRTISGDVAMNLEEGDGVVYRGRQLPHWRTAYDGQIQVQCLLFYVAKEGRCASWKFDRRQGIGMPYVRAVSK